MSYDRYNIASQECSRCITNQYSTSFSLGIKLFKKDYRKPIYDIYGFVRLSDEIVDTFFEHNQKDLFESFRKNLELDFERGLSLNPIIQSYLIVCKEYKIGRELTEAFLDSMEMDLFKTEYNREDYEKYIYGSAEVIGLMCLKVFCKDDIQEFIRLECYARKLGSAFQKINFLRDMKSDFNERGRVYFPNVDYINFNSKVKSEIEVDIQNDFDEGLKGILMLPSDVRLGVLIAYKYYFKLFRKIKKCDSKFIEEERLRVSDFRKFSILISSFVRYKLKVI